MGYSPYGFNIKVDFRNIPAQIRYVAKQEGKEVISVTNRPDVKIRIYQGVYDNMRRDYKSFGIPFRTGNFLASPQFEGGENILGDDRTYANGSITENGISFEPYVEVGARRGDDFYQWQKSGHRKKIHTGQSYRYYYGKNIDWDYDSYLQRQRSNIAEVCEKILVKEIK